MRMLGNTVMPDLLQSIIQWEKEIAPEVPYLDTPTGFYLTFNENDNGGYRCSPVDSIMFADTGYDGIHYSLLTDFGRVTNLNEAPVIRVSPMDFGNCVRMVAKNIRDFFTLHFFGHEGLLLLDFESKEEYLHYLQSQDDAQASEHFDREKWDRERAIVREEAVKAFNLERIEDGFGYVQELQAQRKKDSVLKTLDGLGIVPLGEREEAKEYIPHPWRRIDFSDVDLNELKAFVHNAEMETLLAFIRDFQLQYFNHSEVMQLLYNRLDLYGFHLEAKRLLYCMDVS